LPDGTLASYTITLDLVVFADGSMFGPKWSSESDEVLGMFQGIDAANPSSKGTFRAKKPCELNIKPLDDPVASIPDFILSTVPLCMLLAGNRKPHPP